jgi:hypothetical protein
MAQIRQLKGTRAQESAKESIHATVSNRIFIVLQPYPYNFPPAFNARRSLKPRSISLIDISY